ncbi:MAG: hypothetical protein KDD36_08310 [Flavobacteriales bacterium]|nr:hypothetical protein [Flavobacteriales bacterium]
MKKALILLFTVLFSTTLIMADTNEGSSVRVTFSFEPNLIDPGDVFIINVNVIKGELETKGKITAILPDGFEAAELESEGGTFSFNERIVTISWKNMPVPEEFTVSFEVQSDTSTSGSYSISGRFGYVQDDQNKVINIPTERLLVGKELAGGTVITVKGEGDEKKIRTYTSEQSQELTSTVSAAEIREVSGVDLTEGEGDPAPPEPEKPKVYYRLQIFTDTKEVDTEKYKKKYKMEEDIHVIKDRTKYIYAIGEFQNYKEANAFKREMTGKKFVKTALVVGDQNGNYMSASKIKKILGE